MSESWPDLADVTAALSADSDAQTDAKDAPAATGDKTPSADEIAAALTQDNATKPDADAAKPNAQSQQKVDPKPDPNKEPAKPAAPSDLAARIKEDPRKALAELPEDAIDALQSVLYPKLHQKLSKRDNDHARDLARIQEQNEAALSAIVNRVDERVDDILARTMEPEQFEEFKRQRTEKEAAEKAKNTPTPEVAARQGEIQAYVTQAWDLIADAGLPIPEDRTDFSDIAPEVQEVWAAGWNEKTPLAAMRAMRTKIRELVAAGRVATARPAQQPQHQQPRDQKTGRFVSDDELVALIAKGVKAAREEDELRAGLAVTGARSAGGVPASGKAQTWTENTRDLATALREANARS